MNKIQKELEKKIAANELIIKAFDDYSKQVNKISCVSKNLYK